MGFPSPAKDYAESRLTITSMCGYDGTVEQLKRRLGTQSSTSQINRIRVIPC